MKYPSKPFQSKPGRAEWDAATERPGMLVFPNEEPTGDQTGDWQVLTNDGWVPFIAASWDSRG